MHPDVWRCGAAACVLAAGASEGPGAVQHNQWCGAHHAAVVCTKRVLMLYMTVNSIMSSWCCYRVALLLRTGFPSDGLLLVVERHNCRQSAIDRLITKKMVVPYLATYAAGAGASLSQRSRSISTYRLVCWLTLVRTSENIGRSLSAHMIACT